MNQKDIPRTSSSMGIFFLEACVPDCRTSEPKPSSSSLNRVAILGSNPECHHSPLRQTGTIYALSPSDNIPCLKLPFFNFKILTIKTGNEQFGDKPKSITFSSSGAKTCLTAWYRLLTGESNMEDTRMLR